MRRQHCAKSGDLTHTALTKWLNQCTNRGRRFSLEVATSLTMKENMVSVGYIRQERVGETVSCFLDYIMPPIFSLPASMIPGNWGTFTKCVVGDNSVKKYMGCDMLQWAVVAVFILKIDCGKGHIMPNLS